MIKFFRRIRQRLLSENRLGKYLIYALGEIVLVVIGILIALSINNANQHKQDLARVENLMEKIQINIESDLERINWLFSVQSQKDSLIKFVLNNQVTRSDYENPANSGLRTIVSTYAQINLKKHSFEALTQQQDIITKEFDSIMEILSMLYSEDHDFVMVTEDRYKEEVMSLLQYDMMNHSWYASSSPGYSNSEFLDYLMGTQYRSRVKSYGSNLNEYLNFVAQYRENAIKAYLMINKQLGKELPPDSPLQLTAMDSTLVGKYESLNGQAAGEVYIENGLLKFDQGITAVLHPINKDQYFIQGFGFLRIVDQDGIKVYNNNFAAGKFPMVFKSEENSNKTEQP